MSNLFKVFLLLSVMMISFISCETVEDENDVTLLDIEVTATPTTNSIDLSWKPVAGCYWYFISYGFAGTTLTEMGGYQDLNNNPIERSITGLASDTTYTVKIEGRDYLSGGKLVASKTIKVKTN